MFNFSPDGCVPCPLESLTGDTYTVDETVQKMAYSGMRFQATSSFRIPNSKSNIIKKKNNSVLLTDCFIKGSLFFFFFGVLRGRCIL